MTWLVAVTACLVLSAQEVKQQAGPQRVIARELKLDTTRRTGVQKLAPARPERALKLETERAEKTLTLDSEQPGREPETQREQQPGQAKPRTKRVKLESWDGRDSLERKENRYADTLTVAADDTTMAPVRLSSLSFC